MNRAVFDNMYQNERIASHNPSVGVRSGEKADIYIYKLQIVSNWMLR